MINDKFNFFRCSVSKEECGYHVGRICYISFAKALTQDEAQEYIATHKVKYDDLNIVVDFGLIEEVDTFTSIQNDMNTLAKNHLKGFTLEELQQEKKAQEQKMELYTKQGLYNLVSDCVWYIQNIKEEIEKILH